MYTRWLILAFISGALSLVLVVRHANAHGGVIRNADLCLIKIGYLEAPCKIYLPRSRQQEEAHERFFTTRREKRPSVDPPHELEQVAEEHQRPRLTPKIAMHSVGKTVHPDTRNLVNFVGPDKTVFDRYASALLLHDTKP